MKKLLGSMQFTNDTQWLAEYGMDYWDSICAVIQLDTPYHVGSIVDMLRQFYPQSALTIGARCSFVLRNIIEEHRQAGTKSPVVRNGQYWTFKGA